MREGIRSNVRISKNCIRKLEVGQTKKINTWDSNYNQSLVLEFVLLFLEVMVSFAFQKKTTTGEKGTTSLHIKYQRVGEANRPKGNFVGGNCRAKQNTGGADGYIMGGGGATLVGGIFLVDKQFHYCEQFGRI